METGGVARFCAFEMSLRTQSLWVWPSELRGLADGDAGGQPLMFLVLVIVYLTNLLRSEQK